MQLVAYNTSDIFYLDSFDTEEEEAAYPDEAVNRIFQKKKEKLVDKLKTKKVCEEDCLICFESMKNIDLCECKECKILIHYKCLEKWTETKNTCPHCRVKFK